MKSGLAALGLVIATASLGALAAQTASPPVRPTPPTTTPPQTTPVRPQAPATSSSKPAAYDVGLIGGQVVDSASGRTLARVAVRLRGPGVARTRLTDDKGRFSFPDVPPGDFTITATKFGFYDGAYGKRRAGGNGVPLTLTGISPVPDLRIELFRSAVVSGTVFDEGNEPVVGIKVTALRRQFVSGEWRFVMSATEETDDQGRYRIIGLMPGQYVIAVPSVQVTVPMSSLENVAATGMGAPGLGMLLSFFRPASQLQDTLERQFLFDDDDRHIMLAVTATPPPPESKREFVYPTQYFPVADLLFVARPIEVTAGQDQGSVNFELRPVPAARIKGQVVGPGGAVANQLLRLLPQDGDDFGLGTETAMTVSAPDGTFTFLRVPSGRYTIDASLIPGGPPGVVNANVPPEVLEAQFFAQPAMSGSASVGVNDVDVDGVLITMEPSPTVTGRVFFSGTTTTPRPSADQISRIPMWLTPADRRGRATPARLNSAGEFIVANLSPGRYFLRIDGAPPGWFAKSVMIGGRDASDAPVDLAPGTRALATITFTDRGAEIIGSVRDPRGVIAPGATIIVMPAGSSDAGFNPSRTREVRAATSGTYLIEGLPPGDYYIIAIDDVASEGWQDPAKLAVLRNAGTRITLREGEKRTVELRQSVRR